MRFCAIIMMLGINILFFNELSINNSKNKKIWRSTKMGNGITSGLGISDYISNSEETVRELMNKAKRLEEECKTLRSPDVTFEQAKSIFNSHNKEMRFMEKIDINLMYAGSLAMIASCNDKDFKDAVYAFNSVVKTVEKDAEFDDYNQKKSNITK